MSSEEFARRLDATLRGGGSVEDLIRWVDAATEGEPSLAREFAAVLEAAHDRDEIPWEPYLLIKDRLSWSATRPPRVAAAAAASAATILRATGGQTGRDVTEARAPTDVVAPVAQTGRITASNFGDPQTWTLTAAPPLIPGSRIKQRFVLVEKVGAGGMGVVFKARDELKEEVQDRNPFVALKFLNDDFRKHPEALRAMAREAARSQSLAHPNIITVHDFDRDGTLIYIHMEFLEGEPLDRFIKNHSKGLSLKEALPLIEGAGRALAYAHERGVVHADFKPSNVFLSPDLRPKVLDFGIARAVPRPGGGPKEGTRYDGAGKLGAVTPEYASPEMLLEQEPDPRDDIFSLALVSCELLSGKHPFDLVNSLEAAHRGLKPKRPPGLSRARFRALERALAFKREERTATVEAFLEELSGAPGAPRAAAWALAAIVITASVAGGLWWANREHPDDILREQVFTDAATDALPESKRKIDQRDILLEQGNEYLQLVELEFDAALLSEGVSSAYGAFRNALRMDPTNEQAADGIVRIILLYEEQIEAAIDAGDTARAAQLVAYARKIAPNRKSLLEYEQQVGTPGVAE